MKDEIIVAIDASRNRSGGAKNHINGILANSDPRHFGIKEVHLWSYSDLLNSIPDYPWLVKHNPKWLEKNIVSQIIWQKYIYHKELYKYNCNILYSTTAINFCNFKPIVVMSRELLSFDPRYKKLYCFTFQRARLEIIKFIQTKIFKKADGIIFLTRYANHVVEKNIGNLYDFKIIPHGINNHFRNVEINTRWFYNTVQNVSCIYISDIHRYKNHEKLIQAIKILIKKGYSLRLTLIGDIVEKKTFKKVKNLVNRLDLNKYIIILGKVKNDELVYILKNSMIFIFASGCENLPNILLEGMASGLPIASSSKGPMPEILKDAAIYFDPEDPASIANSLEILINDVSLRYEMSLRAKNYSMSFDWKICAEKTWKYIVEVYYKYTSKRIF
jgi:glycosyltransferase involved in cell wall biosynthesis